VEKLIISGFHGSVVVFGWYGDFRQSPVLRRSENFLKSRKSGLRAEAEGLALSKTEMPFNASNQASQGFRKRIVGRGRTVKALSLAGRPVYRRQPSLTQILEKSGT